MSGAGWDVLMWWVGWGVVAAAMVVVAWALFADRARGRKRCPSCWYDLRGVSGGSGGEGAVCPECGRAVKSERALGRTRRRWWWAVAGVVVGVAGWAMVLAGGARARAGLWETWWTRYVPSEVLVRMACPPEDAVFGVGIGGSDRWGINDAIRGRERRSVLSDRQFAIAEWYSLELWRWDGARALKTRRKWPEGERVRVDFDSRRFSNNFADRTLRARSLRDPEVAGEDRLYTWMTLLSTTIMEPAQSGLGFGARALGVYRERFEVTLTGDHGVIDRWEEEIEFEVVPKAQAVVAVDSPEITRAVLESMRVRPVGSGKQGDEVTYWVEWRWGRPELAGSRVKMELLVDGRVVYTSAFVMNFTVKGGPGVEDEWATDVNCGDADPATFAREKIRVRLFGDRALTLEHSQADAYWAGSVEVSLAELLDRK